MKPNICTVSKYNLKYASYISQKLEFSDSLLTTHTTIEQTKVYIFWKLQYIPKNDLHVLQLKWYYVSIFNITYYCIF
jgi:hypothetical protein